MVPTAVTAAQMQKMMSGKAPMMANAPMAPKPPKAQRGKAARPQKGKVTPCKRGK